MARSRRSRARSKSQTLPWPENEAQMAAVLVDFLEAQDWDVYQEVRVSPDYPTSPVADIVAVKHVEQFEREIVWIIETKTSLNWAVCEQAWQRAHHAHLVSVAVPRKHELKSGWPRPKRSAKGFRFATAALRRFNIGLLLVADPKVVEGRGRSIAVEQVYEPEYQQTDNAAFERSIQRLRQWLKPEHKTMAKAGTKGQRIVTPFRLTCQRLVEVLREHGDWMVLRDAMVMAKHHYKSLNGGTYSMASMIERGIVDDSIEVKRDGRKIFVRVR